MNIKDFGKIPRETVGLREIFQESKNVENQKVVTSKCNFQSDRSNIKRVMKEKRFSVRLG